jgi:hypothetical protein
VSGAEIVSWINRGFADLVRIRRTLFLFDDQLSEPEPDVTGVQVRLDPTEVAEFRWLKPAEIGRLPGLLERILEFLRHFYSCLAS